ncbi:hypothetical protein WJX82_000934 [Trebouxia sp. C0006]
MSARSVRLEALPPMQLLQEANRLRAENVALRDELARANNLAAAQRLLRGVADALQADDSRIEEVLRRYQSGQQVDEYELIDAIGQRKGTKGINSDSSTWSKDIRIVLVAINPHPPTA